MSDVDHGTGPIRVLLIEPQRLLRSALALEAAAEPDIEVAAQAGDAAAALAAPGSDIAVTAAALPDLDACALTRHLLIDGRVRSVVLLVDRADPEWLERGRRAGASGMVDRASTPEQLRRAIRTAAGGHGYVCPICAATLSGGRGAAPAYTENGHPGTRCHRG